MVFIAQAIFDETTEEEDDLKVAVAIQILGWKWMSFLGMPMNNHPEYRSKEARTTGIRVRRLLSPVSLSDDRWKKFLDDNQAVDADMTEPLSYCYCSSAGYSWPERNTPSLMEKKLRELGLWSNYLEVVPQVPRTPNEEQNPHLTSDRVRMLAGLSVWQDKFNVNTKGE